MSAAKPLLPDTPARRLLRAAARGARAAEIDQLCSWVRIGHVVPRLETELRRLRTAVQHCPDPQAHLACDLVQAAVRTLEELTL
jgi:hypothetical protein